MDGGDAGGWWGVGVWRVHESVGGPKGWSRSGVLAEGLRLGGSFPVVGRVRDVATGTDEYCYIRLLVGVVGKCQHPPTTGNIYTQPLQSIQAKIPIIICVPSVEYGE